MPDIEDGESVEIQGSAKDPYILKNIGGVYSCSCPAWRTQGLAIEKRTCKHLRKYRGDAAETERLGTDLPGKPTASRRKPAAKAASDGGDSSDDAASDVPGFLLAHSWDNYVDLTGWWMSEKLDGVRAYWDGKQFISRQGNVYMAPDWFIEDLPADIHLDGELWIERKAFQRTVSIVRRQDKSKDWEAVKYVVFDVPQVDDVFEARMAYLQQCLDELQPRYARPHEQERCKSSEHLLEELNRVEGGGGEGLMLRQPSSKYESGRSSTLLKVKRFHDAEARVLEYLPGTGKHKGRMGALSVELNNGIKFAIGTGFSDKERDTPPPIGSIVTFRYQELTDRGVPRFPSYVRLRTDIDRLPDSSIPSDTASSAAIEAAAKEVEQEDFSPPATPDTASSVAISSPAKQATSNVVTFAPRKASAGGASQSSSDADDHGKPRYFEFTEGTSSKFWQIWRIGNEVIVCYGRIGTDGQQKPKSFKDEDAAKKYYEDIIEEKTDKGYVEKPDELDDNDSDAEDEDEELYDEDQEDDDLDGDEEEEDDDDDGIAVSSKELGSVVCYCSSCRPDLAGATQATAGASKSSATTLATKQPVAAAASPQKAAPTKSAPAAGVRYFEFVEGTSSKFWSIWKSGTDVTVKYGRIGTAGQEKTKSFPDESKAQKYYDEIIEEKVDKGYEEQDH